VVLASDTPIQLGSVSKQEQAHLSFMYDER
jgi:hypothetical protein